MVKIFVNTRALWTHYSCSVIIKIQFHVARWEQTVKRPLEELHTPKQILWINTNTNRAQWVKKARAPYWNFCGICQEHSRAAFCASGNNNFSRAHYTYVVKVKSGESSAGVKFSHRMLCAVCAESRVAHTTQQLKGRPRAHSHSRHLIFTLLLSKCHNYYCTSSAFWVEKSEKLSILLVLTLGCRFPRLNVRFTVWFIFYYMICASALNFKTFLEHANWQNEQFYNAIQTIFCMNLSALVGFKAWILVFDI